jgi:hypothetical protein
LDRNDDLTRSAQRAAIHPQRTPVIPVIADAWDEQA